MGGRIGYKAGSEPMMKQYVVEQKQQYRQTFKILSYTELRARLPQEISNDDCVSVIIKSKQALLDFANIQTTEDDR